MPTDHLITTEEAAHRRGVAVSTISRWVSSGLLTPSLRIRGSRGAMFFDVVSVDAVETRLTTAREIELHIGSVEVGA